MKEYLYGEKEETDDTNETVEYEKADYTEEFYGESSYYIGIGPWTPDSSELSSEELLESPLNLMEAAAIVTLLEDALDELVIIKYVIGVPPIVSDLRYRTPEERFTRRLTPQWIHPEVDNKPILSSAVKLQRERDQIEVVFDKLKESLLESGTYAPLIIALEAIKREEEDDKLLVQELKENLVYLASLKKKVEEKRKYDDQEERGRDELLYTLQINKLVYDLSLTMPLTMMKGEKSEKSSSTRDKLEDVILKCEVERKFVDKWENVRCSQNRLRLKKAEDFYKDGIKKLETDIEVEKRATNEMQNYIKTNQSELEDQLEEWMSYYDSEMEIRENKITRMKYNKDQTEEKKTVLLTLYENRVNEISEWLVFREIRKRRTKASLLIQSWWRGMMVRKKLGPYKPKKGKGERPKKNK